MWLPLRQGLQSTLMRRQSKRRRRCKHGVHLLFPWASVAQGVSLYHSTDECIPDWGDMPTTARQVEGSQSDVQASSCVAG